MEGQRGCRMGMLVSARSTEQSFLRFVNRTKHTLELLWVNYNGTYCRYQLLRKGHYVDVNTYKSHPWIAVEVNSKDRMLLNSKFVYMPITYKEHCALNPNMYQPIIHDEMRKIVCITLPVYSLRYRSLLAVRNICDTEEKVEKLDLPQLLKDDLNRVIALRNRYNSANVN